MKTAKDCIKPDNLPKAKPKGTQSAKNKFPGFLEKTKKQIFSRNFDEIIKKPAKQSQKSNILVCDQTIESKGQMIKSARNLKETFALSLVSESYLSSKPSSNAGKYPVDCKKKQLFLSSMPSEGNINASHDDKANHTLFSP